MDAKKPDRSPGFLHRHPFVNSLVAALLAAFLATGGTIFAGAWQQRTSAHSLRLAFAGEVHSIMRAMPRRLFWSAAAWEKGEVLKDYEFFYPRAVFDANIARLGDLNDPRVVQQLVLLYSTLEQAREAGRRLQLGKGDQEEMLLYVFFLKEAFSHAMALDVSLDTTLSKEQQSQRSHQRQGSFLMQEISDKIDQALNDRHSAPRK